ncbi:hypothetical protein niasHT_023843 [Heterodera trifolii]|uniref:T-complex protein 11-like protein 1 n=1 Tax=Heterodera trifolii TaxID=157864 RepID=A0ABD2JCS4_9BILA
MDGNGSSDSAFTKNNNESDVSSSSSSPDKKRTRLTKVSSPIAVFSSCDDGTKQKKSPKSTEEKPSDEKEGTSAAFPSWVAGASPAKFIQLEDLIRMSDCIGKMNIAHKIATHPNCKVEDFKAADPLYVSVKSNMRKAYWDLLREDLAKEPPEFGHAFSLLGDLKQMLVDHLKGDHLKHSLNAIGEILDMDKLKSLADQRGGLNFEMVIKDVLDVVGRLCAPIRDEMVANLKKETDIVKLFNGVFSLVEMMEIDMTNFKISQNRQLIGSYSAQIEFEEFEKLMQIDESSSQNTKRWLGKILDDFLSSPDNKSCAAGQKDGLTRAQVNELIVNFYLAFLTTNPTDSDRIPFPETLKLDEKLLDALNEKFLQLELTISAIFISANLVGRSVCEGNDFKSQLKHDLIVILNDVNWSNSNQKLKNVYVHCEHKCREAAAENGWNEERGNTLRRQLDGLCRTDDPIRVISRKRLCDFVGQALLRRSSPMRIPPGLSTIQTELASLTSQFYAITVHNWNGFGRYYGQLLDQFYESKWKITSPH